MHDARIGRFFAVDPLATTYPWNSPYAFSENSVIAFFELEGLEKVSMHGDAPGTPNVYHPGDAGAFERRANRLKQSGYNHDYKNNTNLDKKKLKIQ